MNKLTAGIFAGILTIVTVNAARADIATTTYVQGGVKAATDYTDKQVGALTGLTTTAKGNAVAAINEVNTKAGQALTDAKAYTDTLANGAVKANTDAIAVLNGSGEGSVAKLISDAVTGVAGDLTEMQDAFDDFKTTTTESITELGNADAAINAKIGTVESGKTVVQMITDVKTAATTDVDTKLADYVKTADMTDELAKKQDKLGATNVTTTGSGVVKTVVAADGTVSITRSAVAKGELDAALSKEISDNTSAVATLNGADTVEGSVANQIKTAVGTINTTTSGLNTRLTTAEGDIDALQGATAGYTSTNTVAAAVADAKKAGTDASAALDTYKTAQAATDKTQSDAISALEAKVGTTNVSDELAKKMDLATGTQNKLLTTDANGQVVAATATGTCTPDAAKGITCMMVSDGTGFRMEKIVDTYTAAN